MSIDLSVKSCQLCVPIVGPFHSAIEAQMTAALEYADVFELRLDCWQIVEKDFLDHLRRAFASIPMIFTLRKESQGGKFKGSESERLALLTSLLELQPEFVDLEADIPLDQIAQLQALFPHIQWIISWHDFKQTPQNLKQLFAKLSAIPAQYYKLVTYANSNADAMRMLHLAKIANAKQSILCALCMGEFGKSTRILSPLVGNPFVFAAIEEGLESAPGQLSAHALLQHFRHLSQGSLPSNYLTSKAFISRSSLSGEINIPSSKSHSIRAILLGAMVSGTSSIYNALVSPDIDQAIQAACQLGATIEAKDEALLIQGVAGQPCASLDVIDAGNSGQVLRFAAALAAIGHHPTYLTGDHSLRTNRPIQPLLMGLEGLGVEAEAIFQNGYAPIYVKGPIQPGKTELSGEDSQPVSALLMAAAFVEGTSIIKVCHPGEKPWVGLTLAWLDRLQVPYVNEKFESFEVMGRQTHKSFTYTVPGDFSSAAFPLVAALITQSELTLNNLDINDIQGDKAIISILQQMGAQIEVNQRSLYVKKGGVLQGCTIDVNALIDAIPILAVVGCFAKGETRLINGAIARCKESNRIECMASELQKMGAMIEATEEGLIIQYSLLKGAHVHSYRDHRLALSLMVAGLAADGETIVEGVDCIDKSYATFIEDFQQMGAKIKLEL
jgi:3-phosphoshikimate 1-carboxyvinyltransferase